MGSSARLLTDLDDVLLDVRYFFRSPGFRRRVLGSVDVELSTFRLLRAVERHPGDPTVGDVAASVGIDQSTASRQIDAAVRTGLLSRQRCSDDARRSRLELTPEGASVLAEVNRLRQAALAEVLDGWPNGDAQALIRLLVELRTGMQRLAE